jgi:hypothetical protein
MLLLDRGLGVQRRLVPHDVDASCYSQVLLLPIRLHSHYLNVSGAIKLKCIRMFCQLFVILDVIYRDNCEANPWSCGPLRTLLNTDRRF